MPRKQKKYHYIYKTTNLVNNKFYIGMHSTDKLDDDYLGSGKQLKYSIGKHGKENHIKEILEFLPDRKSLAKREEELVNEDLLKEDLCMNLKYGGEGGGKWYNHPNSLIPLKDPKIKKKAQLAGAKTRVFRYANDKDYREKHYNRLSLQYRKYVEENGFYWTGKTHSKETKKKMSESAKGKHAGEKNSQYGTCWIHSLIEEKSIKIKKEELRSYINEGWIKGRKMKF